MDRRTTGFNTWDADHPACLSHLASGLTVRLIAYSHRAGAVTRFPAAQPGIRLGERTLDGGVLALELEHAGTVLEVRCESPAPECLRASWQATANGEWGLRFWVVVAVELRETDERAEWIHDPDSGLLSARWSGGHAVVAGERAPLLVTFHSTVSALEAELDQHGYWFLESRGTRGRVAALRYNLEEMPRFTIGAAVGADTASASRAARAMAQTPAESAPGALHTGRHAGALDAVRDVMGWNTVHDTVNARRYTALSRGWSLEKFGGFGVWLDDVLYHALLAGHLDLPLAVDNLAAVYAAATPQGNLPCLVTGRDAWVDRSQPPIGAYVLWLLYLRWGERALLETGYPVLLANHEWWWRERDGNGNGLLEYGTSPVGDGLYRGTKLAAKDESSMDNSPVHDEARLIERSWTLDCEDVGLNSLLALDGEMLANVARVLGRDDEATRLAARADTLRALIRDELWDEARGVFANRLWSGAHVRSIAPTSFYPLLAGAATAAQVDRLVGWLEDPALFGGEHRLPSVSRDDPAFADNVYWRGRVWPPLNFLVYHGLRRAGREREAARLAEDGERLFMSAWRRDRHCAENYGAVTGAVTDQPDTDTFYGWGALLPAIAVAEVCDVSPWEGFSVRHDGDVRLGPLRCPPGTTVVESAGGVLSVVVDGVARLRTTVRGRLQALVLEQRQVTTDLPPGEAGEWLELPNVEPTAVTARLAGEALQATPSTAGTRLALPARGRRSRLEALIS